MSPLVTYKEIEVLWKCSLINDFKFFFVKIPAYWCIEKKCFENNASFKGYLDFQFQWPIYVSSKLGVQNNIPKNAN
jgi:hypothetical protein